MVNEMVILELMEKRYSLGDIGASGAFEAQNFLSEWGFHYFTGNFTHWS